MNILSKPLLYISLSLLSLPLFSQIRGNVKDTLQQPVALANIVLLQASDSTFLSGVATDADGDFTMATFKKSENTLLRVSAIGYHTRILEVQSEDMGTITLEEDSRLLAEVSIKGSRTYRSEDRFILMTDSIQAAQAVKATQYLDMQQLPGLRVDRLSQSISVNGGQPVLQINGRPVTERRIASLNAEDILRIEYTNTPGVRYVDQNATGVINFVLKRIDSGGNVFASLESAANAKFMDHSLNGSYHRGRHELSWDYSFSWRDYKDVPTIMEDHYTNPDLIVDRYSLINTPFYYVMHTIRPEWTMQVNDSTMFIASLQDVIFQQGHRIIGEIQETAGGTASSKDVYKKRRGLRSQPRLDLYYSQKFRDGRKLELNTVLDLGHESFKDSLIYKDPGAWDIIVKDNTENAWALSAEAAYSRSTRKLEFKTGIQYQHHHSRDEYRRHETVTRMDKDNVYIYGELDPKLSEKLSLSLGTGMKIFNVNENGNKKGYLRNLSTIHMTWNPRNSISLMYEAILYPVLPSLSQLSPVRQRTDEYTALQGNPHLRPSDFLAQKVSFYLNTRNGMFVNFYGEYDRRFSPIVTVYHYDSAQRLYVQQPFNAKSFSAIIGNLEFGVKNLWGHLDLSGMAEWKKETSRGEDFRHVNRNFNSWIKILGHWNNWNVGASFSLAPQWSLDGEQLSRSESQKDIFVRYTKRNFSATVAWYSPLCPDGFKYENRGLSKVNPFKETHWTRENGNMVTLALSYKMDFGKRFKKGDKTLQNGGLESGQVR